MTKILGISAFFHDSAASLIVNGKLVAAAQEERFTRIKHDKNFPKNAIEYVLKEKKIELSNVDYVVFFEKPFLKFERLIETYLAYAPVGFKSFSLSMPIWLKEKLFQKKFLFNHLKKIDKNFNDINKLKFSEHHFSHAASAFYPSPFEEALILTIDGVGEWATTTVCHGEKNKITVLKEIHFPHSLGLLYTAFTYYLGFKVNSGEYKVMGLAPYGEPIFYDAILENLLDLKDDGTFRLDMKYFNFATGLTMVNKKFEKLFNHPTRKNDENLVQFHMDIASSIQKITEEIILKLTKNLKKEYGLKNLCMAGGVALNCVANGKILNNNIFENIWIQPAAGDAGGSLGAALGYWYQELNNKRIINPDDSMEGAFLGPKFNNEKVEKDLIKLGAKYQKVSQNELIQTTADELSRGKIVGWFQGRMEFGPRALGARSILADPRYAEMQKELNLKIKFRESFRPFAPAILIENLNDWFNINKKSPYMLLVSNLNKKLQIPMSGCQKKLFGIEKLNIKRSIIPAITHVDYSARIQTIDKKRNNLFYSLLKKFNSITNCPILVNTSFNVRGEPIVCSPTNAFKCFMGTDLDILVIENFILYKSEQDKKLKINYKDKFNLD